MNKYINYFLIGCVLALALLSNKKNNRLNEHKKVIELMNEANKSQQESINLLMKNQILLNNKLKRYEKKVR